MNRSPRYARKLKQRARAFRRREIRAEARALAEQLRADLARSEELAAHYRSPWWKLWEFWK